MAIDRDLLILLEVRNPSSLRICSDLSLIPKERASISALHSSVDETVDDVGSSCKSGVVTLSISPTRIVSGVDSEYSLRLLRDKIANDASNEAMLF